LEIIRSTGGSYIDFKNGATEDYDFRIAQQGATSTLEFLSSAGFAASLNNTGLYLQGSVNSTYLFVRAQGGTHGGELSLEKPPTGSTLNGNMVIDTISNRLRILESGSPFRGAFLNIDTTANGAGSEILHSNNYPTYLNGAYVLKTGDTMTGSLQVNGNLSTSLFLQSGAVNSAMWQNDTTAGLEVRNNAGGSPNNDANLAAIRFHAVGAWGVKLGLRPDGHIGIGGWSAAPWRWYLNTANGDMTAAGNVIAYSDARLKTNVVTISNALDLVDNMRGVKFTRTDTGAPGVGVIAQELQQVLPELVTVAEDGDTLGVSYGNLTGVLIEAIKSLHAQNKLLTNRLNSAWEIIQDLSDRLR